MTRADTMQVFANVLVRGGAALPGEQQTAAALKNVKDAAASRSPGARQSRCAWSRDLISGYDDGTIRPQQTITRAAFAKLMVTAEFWKSPGFRKNFGAGRFFLNQIRSRGSYIQMHRKQGARLPGKDRIE